MKRKDLIKLLKNGNKKLIVCFTSITFGICSLTGCQSNEVSVDSSKVTESGVVTNKDLEFTEEIVNFTPEELKELDNLESENTLLESDSEDYTNAISNTKKEDNSNSSSSYNKNSNSSTSLSKESASSSYSNNSSNSNSISSNTNTTANNSSSNNDSSKITHSHSWVKSSEYINHAEEGEYQQVLVSEAWAEEVPIYENKTRAICNGCGKDITDDITGHTKAAMLAGNTACGGYHTEKRSVQTGTDFVEHEAEYETIWVVTKEAWTEEVVKYTCSCGAVK